MDELEEIKKEVANLKHQAIIIVKQIKDMERYINQFVRVNVQPQENSQQNS